MKIFIRTIAVFAILSLTATNFAAAQVVPSQPEPASTVASQPDVRSVGSTAKKTQNDMAAAQEQMVTAAIAQSQQATQLSDQLRQLRSLNGIFPRSGGRVLVIPAVETQAQDLAKIVEDMTVMARIIDKQLKQQSGQVWFYGDVFGQSTGTTQTMYLQGYGALFLRKVDFLLTPPPKVQEQEKEIPKEDVDPVWEQTRRDLYEPQGDRRRGVERPEEKYDAEKVENLKTDLVKSLKHAANIRNLKPEESVILAVTGGGGSSNVTTTPLVSTSSTNRIIVKDKGNKSTGMSISAPTLPSLPSGTGFSSPTVLIMRAKKADIDAFAADKLNLETFRQRVQIFTTEIGSDGQDGEMIVQY